MTFSQESLEHLLIAVAKLTDEDGKALVVKPSEVLQPWVISMLPQLPPELSYLKDFL